MDIEHGYHQCKPRAHVPPGIVQFVSYCSDRVNYFNRSQIPSVKVLAARDHYHASALVPSDRLPNEGSLVSMVVIFACLSPAATPIGARPSAATGNP
jgi:hypothetical protein